MLAETSRTLPLAPAVALALSWGSGPLPVGAGGWSRLCPPQEASQVAAAATGPCLGLGDDFFPLHVAAGTVYNRKKKENDQASRLENKETLQEKG